MPTDFRIPYTEACQQSGTLLTGSKHFMGVILPLCVKASREFYLHCHEEMKNCLLPEIPL